MLLIVDPKRTIWGYKEELWFTYVDGPKKVVLSTLSQGAQQAVSRAIGKGALIEVDQNGKSIRKGVQKLQQPLVEDSDPTGLQGVPHFMVEKLKELLENGVTSLRREISLVKSAHQIAALISLERSGKNRKTVLKLLDDQMEKTTDLNNPRLLNGNMNMYDVLIKEEEGETVEFNTSGLSVVEEAGEEINAESVSPEVIESSEEVVELDSEMIEKEFPEADAEKLKSGLLPVDQD